MVPKVALVAAHNFKAENSFFSEAKSAIVAVVSVLADMVTGEVEVNSSAFALVAQRQSELGAEKVGRQALEDGMPPAFARDQYLAKLEADGRTPREGDAFLASLELQDAETSRDAGTSITENLEPIPAAIVSVDEIATRSAAREAFVPSAVMASVVESLRVAEGNNPTLATDEYRENREFASNNELHNLFDVADRYGQSDARVNTSPLMKRYVEMREVMLERQAQTYHDAGMTPPMQDYNTVRGDVIAEMQKHKRITREEYTEISQTLLDEGVSDAYPLLNNVTAVAASRYTVKEVLADADGYGAITHKVAADKGLDLEQARQQILDGDKDFFFTGNDNKEASKIALLSDEELVTYTAQARATAETMLAEGSSEHPLYKALVASRDVEADAFYTNYELQNTPELMNALLGENSPLDDGQKAALEALRDTPLDEAHLVQRGQLLDVAVAKIERLSAEKLQELGVTGIAMPLEVQGDAYGVTVAEVNVLREHNRSDVLAAMLPAGTNYEEAMDSAKHALTSDALRENRNPASVVAGEFSTLSLLESELVESRAKAQIGMNEPVLKQDSSPAPAPVEAEEIVEKVKISAAPVMNPFGDNGAEQLAMLNTAKDSPLKSVDAGVAQKAAGQRNPDHLERETQIG